MRTKVLGLVTAQLAITVMIGLLMVRSGAPLGAPWRVAALAAAFALVERFPMRLEFRRNQCTLTLADAVFVLGLFWIGPFGVAAAGAASAVGTCVFTRVAPLKLVFNVSCDLLAMTAASAVFYFAVGAGDPQSLWSWGVALGASVCYSACNMTSIAAVLAIAERRSFHEIFLRSAVMSLLVTLSAAPLGLIALALFNYGIVGPLMLAPVAVAVAINSRNAAAQRDEHLRFERLYEASSRTARLVDLDQAVAVVAAEARSLTTASWALCATLTRDDGWMGVLVGDDGTRPAGAEAVDALVLLASGRDAQEVDMGTLAGPVRAVLPTAATVVLVSSPEGSAAPVILAAFRDGESSVDATAEGRVATLSAFAAQAALAIANARLLEEVEDALRQQVDLNRQKGDFVAAVSHELRTPLTSVLGSVSTVLRLEERLDAEKRGKLLTMALDQGQRLKRLIEELLLVAAAEESTMHRLQEPIEIPDLLAAVSAELTTMAGDRLDVECGPDVAVITSDRHKLHRILLNLAENATKYAPVGPIEVRAAQSDDRTVFTVSDHGPGIPADERGRVFERFVQLDQSSTRRNGGTGLGLYLCRQLASLLGGTLELSENDGGGCRFALDLPSGVAAGSVPARSQTRVLTRPTDLQLTKGARP